MKPLYRFVSKVCFKIGGYCNGKIYGSEQSKRVKPWFKINGDETLRLDYPLLNENSLVIDLGGYKGQWASDIYGKYNCTVWVFEPFKEFADKITNRFSKNAKVKSFDFGLGKLAEKKTLYIADNSSSIHKKEGAGSKVEIRIEDISEFFRKNNIKKVDLLKINIEGDEYDVLERLIETGLIRDIVDIQVQFHDFVDNARGRMKNIQDKLRETHKPTYQYEFVWENWQKL